LSDVQLVQASFDRMLRDLPRDRLPKGSVWNALDMIPNELGAPLSKRGGWAYASLDLTATLTGADAVLATISAPFAAGEQLVAWVWDSGAPSAKLAQIVSSSSTTARGVTGFAQPGQPPVFYRNFVYYVDAGGAVAPWRYSGAADIAVLTGSPPTGGRCCVYKDRLLLARSSAQLQRVWFSAAGTPTTWDTTFGYIDTSAAVEALYPLRNAVLIFHTTSLERIIGSTPPPGTDMSLQPLFDVGTTYPFSVTGTDEFVCFANQSGVFMTDGSTVVDLTEQGGMKSYWRSLFSVTRGVSGGYFRGYYVVVIRDLSGGTPAGTFVDGFLVHLKTRRFTRLSNFPAFCFSPAPSATDELHFGLRNEARVGSISSIFTPTSTVKNDANGTAVTPTVETAFFATGQSKGSVHDLYVTYDMRDSASDNPVLTLSYILDPTSTSYTAVEGSTGAAYTLPETLELTRVRRNVRKHSFGVAMKLAQTNASSKTDINRLEIRARPREGSRVG
jgi:hypothetical protein